MKTNKIMPPTYLLISIGAMALLHFIFPVAIITPSVWNLLGVVPVVLGAAINRTAAGVFQKTNTTISPFQESSALVTSGLFRFSRNPMYLGFMLMLIGLAILMRSLSPYIAVILFWLVMEKKFIIFEEKMLETKFGDEWLKYKNNVRRWL